MKAKLVYKTEYQRFYKLSEPFKILPIKDRDLKELLAEGKSTLRDEYQELVPENADSWDCICISDATTHIERLVFLGIFDGEDASRLGYQKIDGKHTFMIDGGDASEVYADKVYLRRIAMANKQKFEGIEDDFNSIP